MKINLRKLKKNYPKRNSNKVYFLENPKICYIANAKCATSTIKLYLERIYRDDQSFVTKNIHKDITVPTVKEFGWEEASKRASDYFIFSFVRDPAARLISCYFNKKGLRKTILNPILGRPEKTKMSFNDFLTAIANQPYDEMNPHWRPQSTLLMIDAVNYDFIGHLENFREDWSNLLKRTGLPNENLEIRNVNKSTRIITPNSKQMELIKKIYSEDYKNFGY